MKLAEAKETKPIEVLPQIDLKDIRLLWYSGFYDGALSGLLSYDGRKYWFDIFDEPTPSRRYFVIELSDAQLREAEYWHELFREKVGTHTDYNENKRRTGTVKSEATWKEFYEPFQKRVPEDYSENTVIGWFEW